MTRHAEDPFLIGRELISQGCDWPNENLVSYTGQTAKTFSSFTVISSIDRIEGCVPFVKKFVKKFCAPRATTPVFSLKRSRRSEGNQKISFLKYLTPPDFCFFHVRRRVVQVDDVSH